jgi:hypothetical protein
LLAETLWRDRGRFGFDLPSEIEVRMSLNKFNAVRTNGMGSKLEAAVYELLLLHEKAGEITSILQQQRVHLANETISYARSGKTVIRPIFWKVDFSAVNRKTGKKFWIEAKGVETREYKSKLKIWREEGPGELWIYKGSWRNPKLVEIVRPQK